MQLSEMRVMLRALVGNPSIVDATDSALDEKINLAMHDISDRYRFHKARKRCTFLTVVGQSSYSLPSDLSAIYRLQDLTNFKKLEKIGDRQFSSVTNDDLGKPLKYVRYRDFVELLPIPDGIYTIELFYKYFVQSLEQDGSVPGIPPAWHYGIVLLGKWYYYIGQSDTPKAASAYESFKLWASDKPTEIDEESVDIDSGVDILTLSQQLTPRQDFNHAD